MEDVIPVEEKADMSRAAEAVEKPHGPGPALDLDPQGEASVDHSLDHPRTGGVTSAIARFAKAGSREIEQL